MAHQLKAYYQKELRAKLANDLSIVNPHAIPKVTKVSLNMGLGRFVGDKKKIAEATEELMLIAGQKPVITRARQSNANFKIREGWPIGVKVTLHGDNMYLFLERLLYVVLPRVRDFQGLSEKSFDGRGNYSLGIHEHTVFPEIPFETVSDRKGLDMSVITNIDDDVYARALLKALGFPFTKEITS